MLSYTRALLFAGTCLVLAGCGNSGAWLGVSRNGRPEAGWQLAAGPLPDEPHISSATAQIDGTDFEDNGGDVSGTPPQVSVDASTVDLSWVRYGFGIPAGGTFNSISLDLPDVNDVYWVGLSNYSGLNAWEWYGPYDDSAVITPLGAPEDYLSGTRNLYWVVLATRGNSCTLASSTVDYDYEPPVLYHVPPPEMQVITTEASAFPSLIRLPAIDGLSENGAPLVFYTDVTAADTFVAYYDGAAWTSRRLFPDGPAVLMATARLSQYMEISQLIVAAYDPLADEVTRSTLTPELEVLASSAVGNDPTGTITALAMDCQDSAIWCVAQARRSETSSFIGASYDDLTESIKFPYTAELPDEEIAGLDVAYEQVGPSFYKPVVAFSHGTIDTSDTILLDFSVTLARPPGQPWDTSEADYNAPLTLDLDTDPEGNLTMLMVSGRDLDILTYKATLFFDAVLGTWTGTDWFYEPIYEGDTSINIFQKTITLDMAGDVSWAGDGALSFANFQGNVEFDLTNGFEITGGNVQNETKYYTKLGGGWGESSYFTGTPGVQLSWQDGPGGPACAYIKAETIDITDLLDGNLSINNELRYWSPEV